MRFQDQLYGFGETAALRQAASLALSDALIALVSLDNQAQGHRMRGPWLRLEREIGVVQALRETGAVADPTAIFRARMGLGALERGHVQLAELDSRLQRWAQVNQRKGSGELRALVAGLVPDRNRPDLAALADRIAIALQRCTSPAWTFSPRTGGQVEVAVSHAVDGASVDSADLALAIPFALRRAGLVRTLMPSLSGRVRRFAREQIAPLAQMQGWAETLGEQASESAARLRLLERHAQAVDLALAGVRRPAPLRRLTEQAAARWCVWAAQLARDNDIEVSTAWRTLQQAAELRLIVEVPAERRSRGDGTLYAIPPVLQIAGLIAAPRGRPPRTVASQVGIPDLRQTISELDAAMAAIDGLTPPAAVA